MTKYIAPFVLAGLLGSVGCDLDVPDLNNPPLDDLINSPTRDRIALASTGIIVGARRNVAAPNGFVSQLGILGRESYSFDGADPRFITELLQGGLAQGSPFGGNFWTLPYANIRLANTVIAATDKVGADQLSAEEKAAVKGFARTIIASDLLEVIVAHDTNGAVVDTNRGVDQDLAPIVDRDAALTAIAKLLDDANTELAGAGGSFPFAMSTGYTNFGPTPEITFAEPANFAKFNRALRARVAAYQEDYATVLTALEASFIIDPATSLADLDVGVYHAYSTGTGDVANGLFNPNLFTHPSVPADAQKNGTTPDARLSRKVRQVPDADAGASRGLSSKFKFTIYPKPDTAVAQIRNEELLLLKAEAQFFSDPTPAGAAAANATLNNVRTVSGGLTALAVTTDEATFVDELLYERRYSLLFEGGHRWIDQRRFGKELLLDKPEHKRNIRYPIPRVECNARPDEERCTLGSQ